MSCQVYVQGQEGYVGTHILRALQDRQEYWEDPPEDEEPEDEDEEDEDGETPKVNKLQLLENIAEESLEDALKRADVIVLNLFDDLEKANSILKIVRSLKLTKKKTLLCLSTALTWSDSPFNEEEPLDEAKFKSRKCQAHFKRFKLLETLCLNSAREYLHTFVVASGVLYGSGEELLHPLFKRAWLAEEEVLNFIGKGDNVIPTIHVKDMSNIIVRVLERPPKQQRYVVALDASTTTQKSIIDAVAFSLGNGKTESISADNEAVCLGELGDPYALQSNLVFAREEKYVSSLKNFRWVSEEGLPKNVNKVVNEFLQARDLRPIRVFVHGAPGSGKSTVSTRLAQKYHLPHVQIANVIEKAKAKDDEFVEQMTKATPKTGRIPVEFIAKMVKNELNQPLYRNKGFVLDGFPRSLAEAQAVFEQGEEEEEEVPETDDEEEGARPPKRPVSIVPDLVINLAIEEELALQRLQNLDSEKVIANHNDEAGFKRRWKAFQDCNASSSETSPTLFFGEIEVLDIDVKEGDEDEANRAMDMYMETGGQPFNYHPTEEELLAVKEAEQQKLRERRDREEAAAKELEEAQVKEELAIEQSEVEAAKRVKEIEQGEKKMLEKRSVPLRSYLMNTVMPTITEGLFELAKVQPEDPVDYLAEYLFRHSSTQSESST